ncbi:MAG TPA: hypothetical protein VNB94_13660 [Mycobacteriales bacterium]|nr:hypothetical protein [Mycobacteriales bacterium]
MKLFARSALIAAVASASVFSTSAGAAPTILTLTDVRGDANAINGQSARPGMGNRSGPVQKADSDIVSLTLARTGTTKRVDGKKIFTCTGFTATMELAAPAGDNSNYRVAGVGVVNSFVFWLRYQSDPFGTKSYITYGDGDSPARGLSLKNPAQLIDNKIIFSVTEADLTATGEKLTSFRMSQIGADTRTSARLAVPAWDELDQDHSRSFKPCA